MTPAKYDPEVGWVTVHGVLSPGAADGLARDCDALALNLVDPRAGDKPHGDTVRLTALDERLPETVAIAEALAADIDQILPGGWEVAEIAYRSPGSGTGAQKLHADDQPRLSVSSPESGATAVVALADFTAENGATRVVPGSHKRLDLQRLSQKIDHHQDEELLLGPAGTAFVFSRHVLHAGSLNRSPASRPALQISYHAIP